MVSLEFGQCRITYCVCTTMDLVIWYTDISYGEYGFSGKEKSV